MAEKIVMPKIGLSMTEGTIKKWYKQEGDTVEKGEALFSVATGKLTNDVECSVSGTLLKIVTPMNGKAKCKETIAIIGETGEDITALLAECSAGDAEEKQKKESVSMIVIGGGPGGYVAAIRAAQLGAKVTLIEKNKMGGTCLNVGCIPTKALLHSADVYAEMKGAAKIGIKAEHVSIDWEAVQSYKKGVTDQLTAGVSGLMGLNGITIIEGEASFIKEKELKITKADGSSETMTADKIIIAAGSVPAIPPIPGVKENSNCIDSTKALSLEKIPQSMVIIGGGVIGVELACAYSRLGTKITVLEMLPKLMPMMDGELTQIAQQHMEKDGVTFHLEAQVLAVEEDAAGAKVKVKMKDGSEQYFTAEKVLVAVGRRTDTAALQLENAKIANDRGRITVNEKMETNVPGVYAIGDCVGKIMLAHMASAMGEIAAENATGENKKFTAETNPSCVYLDLEFAGVGLTEEKAKENGIDYKVGKFPLAANGKSLIMGCADGWIKVLANKKNNKLIGAHILGPRATDMIAEAALAIRLGATLKNITDTIHAHPTVAEAFREAALAVDDIAIHIK